MDLHLKDKVVLITGGAKGIGAAIVRAVAAESAIPVIVDRDAEAGRRPTGRVSSQRTNCRRTLPSGKLRSCGSGDHREMWTDRCVGEQRWSQ